VDALRGLQAGNPSGLSREAMGRCKGIRLAQWKLG
jgi:hypothetical protein